MTTLVFGALGRGDQQTGYTAAFPDLPGVSAAGANMAELLASARGAVQVELQRLTDDGLEWPAATPIERLALDAGALPFLVDVLVEDTAVRVNISIGERLLQRIDQAAAARTMSRSAFIASASRAALGERTGKAGAAEFNTVARRLQEEWTELSRKITEGLGPDSAFKRSMTDLDNRLSETIRKTADSISAAMARRNDPEETPTMGEPTASTTTLTTKP